MSKKLVFPLVALFSMGVAVTATGCKASASAHIGSEPKAATAEPPPAPPPPPPAPEPEKKEVPIKAMGKAKIENNEIKIPGKVHFEFNKSAIKEDKETKEILDTLLEVLKENPAITKLRIEGHTDDKGDSPYNHKLSQSRADAVADWLAKKGVDKGRIATVGLGEEHPLVANDTDAHREENRRTEFKIWEVEGKPTDAAKASGGTPATPADPKAGAAATPADPKAGAKPADPKANAATPAKPADPKAGTAATPATPAKK